MSDLDALLLPVHDFEAQFRPGSVLEAADHHHSRLLSNDNLSKQYRGNNKTSIFFQRKFSNAKLKQEPQQISTLIQKFEQHTKSIPRFSQDALPELAEPSMVVPRTEQDVMCVLECKIHSNLTYHIQ